MPVSEGTYQEIFVDGWWNESGTSSPPDFTSAFNEGWFHGFDELPQPEAITDIIFGDGRIYISSGKDVREGCFAHRLDKKINLDTDLIKIWNGLGSL